MNQDLRNIRRLTAALRENLLKCAADPDVDPVHDTRTGTRRLQATLESLVRQIPPGDEGDAVRTAAGEMMRLLKKVRRAAGPVRDLDVHRKLLKKLSRRALGEPEKSRDKDESEPQETLSIVGEPDALERPEAGRRISGVEQQADHLDAWLKHRREQSAGDLQDQAAGAAQKLDKRLAELEAALRAHGRRVAKKPPAVVALDSFARLAMEMQHLDAGNLHDFRKGAKKARYVAELASQGDAQAQQVADTLKKLQDEIGDWHDWLVLADEAHDALGNGGAELIALAETEREQHFVAAMKTAAKLRGRLLGEWLAMSASAARRRPPRPAQQRPGAKAAVRRASA